MERWKKAIVISLIFHGVALTGVGWMVAEFFVVHEVSEQYFELELASESNDGSGKVSNMTPDNSVAHAEDVVTPSVPIPVPAVSLVSTEPVPIVQAFANNMSVISTEVGDHSNATVASAGKEGSGTGSGDSGTETNVITSQSGKGSGISSPGILSRNDPTYPEQARRAGREGTVTLKIQILENGRPGDISIYHSSNSDLLDDAAVTAVREWRFIPAKNRESGQSIVCYTTMPVVFRLKS